MSDIEVILQEVANIIHNESQYKLHNIDKECYIIGLRIFSNRLYYMYQDYLRERNGGITS